MTIFKAIIAAWSSRKLWAFLITVTVLWIGLERLINHIYAMDVAKVPHLVTLASIVFGIIGCAAGAYMGFQTWQSRFSADSVASAISETITENRTEKIIEEYANKYRDDPSYAPVKPDTEEEFR